MAEIVGVVSAGAGLLSLTIQLAESIQKLKSFQNKVKNAPTTLADLIFELELTGLSLDLLERRRCLDSEEADLLARCLNHCRLAVQRIQDLVDRIQAIVSKHPILANLYVASKDPDFARLLRELDRARDSLALSFSIFTSEQQRRSGQIQHAMLQRQASQIDNIWAQIQSNTITLSTFSNLSSHGTCGRLSHGLQPFTTLSNGQGTSSAYPKHTRRRHPTRSKFVQEEMFSRFRFPELFISRVWNLSLLRISIGFKISLGAYMGREPEAEIFLRCATGNTKAVQKLIRKGQASLRDVSDGKALLKYSRRPFLSSFTLLQIAVCNGHTDLFQWLWQASNGQGIDADGLVDALSWGSSWDTIPGTCPWGSSSDIILRTCLDGLGIDSTSSHGLRIATRLLRSDPELLLQCQSFYHPQIAAQLMFTDMRYRRNFLAAETFTQLMGMTKWSPELSTLNDEGFSILHFAARMLSSAPQHSGGVCSAVRDWLEIVATSLKHGVEPCAIPQDCEDGVSSQIRSSPFLELVKGLYDNHLYQPTTIQSWLKVIQHAGPNLDAYGQQEEIAWREFQERLLEDADHFYFSYGPEPLQWEIYVARSQSVPRLRLEPRETMPGTFPSLPTALSPYIPRDICWEPDVFCDHLDIDEWHWRCVEDKSYLLQPRRMSEVVAERWPDRDKGPQAVMDDSAIVVSMAHQRPRSMTLKRRSASVPPSKYGKRCNELRLIKNSPVQSTSTTPWYSNVHFCIATMSYEFEPFWGVRYCMSGSCRPGKDEGPIQTTDWWKRNSFLAEICICKDGWPRNSNASYDPGTFGHTGTKDCPWGCSKVHVDKLHVSQDCQPYHPKRQGDERWDEP